MKEKLPKKEEPIGKSKRVRDLKHEARFDGKRKIKKIHTGTSTPLDTETVLHQKLQNLVERSLRGDPVISASNNVENRNVEQTEGPVEAGFVTEPATPVTVETPDKVVLDPTPVALDTATVLPQMPESLAVRLKNLMSSETTGKEGTLNKEVDMEKEKIMEPCILDGKNAHSLIEAMVSFHLETGDTVLAGTDKGINYRDHNEDRVAVHPGENFVAVVDGMGGAQNGELAATIISENILKATNIIPVTIENAKQEMRNRNIGDGGAVFITAKIFTYSNGEKYVEIAQSGYAKIIILDKNGDIKYVSKDQSVVQELIDSKNITEDEALYHNQRHVVMNAVTAKENSGEVKVEYQDVSEGDIVLLMSDGISDNFTPEEISEKQKKGSLEPVELFRWLSDESGKRMRDKDTILKLDTQNYSKTLKEKREQGTFSDGYKSAPKTDNRALVIVTIQNTNKVEINKSNPDPLEATLRGPISGVPTINAEEFPGVDESPEKENVEELTEEELAELEKLEREFGNN